MNSVVVFPPAKIERKEKKKFFFLLFFSAVIQKEHKMFTDNEGRLEFYPSRGRFIKEKQITVLLREINFLRIKLS
jgi:hypothetical protein